MVVKIVLSVIVILLGFLAIILSFHTKKKGSYMASYMASWWYGFRTIYKDEEPCLFSFGVFSGFIVGIVAIVIGIIMLLYSI